MADSHTVIGCVRRDLALFDVPKLPRKRQQGRPAKYGARPTPARIVVLPEHRSAEILYGKLEVVRYRTCLVAARFLPGRVVRAVWVDLERTDRRDKPGEQRLPICTDPGAVRAGGDQRMRETVGGGIAVQESQTWLGPEGRLAAVASGVDALGQPAGGRLRINQMLAFIDPARLAGLAEPAPWRAPCTRTAGLIRAGIARILHEVGLPAFITAIRKKSVPLRQAQGHRQRRSPPKPRKAPKCAIVVPVA